MLRFFLLKKHFQRLRLGIMTSVFFNAKAKNQFYLIWRLEKIIQNNFNFLFLFWRVFFYVKKRIVQIFQKCAFYPVCSLGLNKLKTWMYMRHATGSSAICAGLQNLRIHTVLSSTPITGRKKGELQSSLPQIILRSRWLTLISMAPPVCKCIANLLFSCVKNKSENNYMGKLLFDMATWLPKAVT